MTSSSPEAYFHCISFVRNHSSSPFFDSWKYYHLPALYPLTFVSPHVVSLHADCTVTVAEVDPVSLASLAIWPTSQPGHSHVLSMTFESSRTHPDAGTFQPNPARPQFNSFKTSDRIRESSTVTSPSSKIRKGRRSVFREEGLSIDTDNQGRSQKDSTEDESRTDLVRNEEQEFGDNTGLSSSTPITPTTKNSSDHIEDLDDSSSKARTGWLSRLTMPKRPRIRSAASAPPGTSMTGYTRVATVALLIALVLPAARYNTGRQRVELSGVDAMVLNNPGKPVLDNRQNNPTDICARWSGQGMSLCFT